MVGAWVRPGGVAWNVTAGGARRLAWECCDWRRRRHRRRRSRGRSRLRLRRTTTDPRRSSTGTTRAWSERSVQRPGSRPVWSELGPRSRLGGDGGRGPARREWQPRGRDCADQYVGLAREWCEQQTRSPTARRLIRVFLSTTCCCAQPILNKAQRVGRRVDPARNHAMLFGGVSR
jgi:hypothetical protein